MFGKEHFFAPDGCEAYVPHRDIALWYSPDDNGYYWQELYGEWLTSRAFKSFREAWTATEEEMCWGEES
jgi:hypothetical protein